MATLFSLVTIAISIIACYTIYYFLDSKRQAKANGVQEAEKMLDDTSYIQEMKHLYGKYGFAVWQLITRYVETVIRRTFGTKDAMKLAQPVRL